MRISNDELAAVLVSMHGAAEATQQSMQQSAVQEVNNTWGPALSSAAGTNLEQRILASGAFSVVGPASITLNAAVGGPVSGGLTEDSWPAVEFGMTPVQIIAPNRRKKIRFAGSGREATVVTRIWVGKNLRPRNEEGYVVFPTVRKHGPRFVAAWIYGLVRAWEGTQFDVRKG